MATKMPQKVLEASGAFKKNPGRRRVEPDTAGPLGDPPEDLTSDEVESWNLIVSEAPLNVLTVADRAVVELAARLRAYIKKYDMDDIQAAKLTMYNKCLTQLGMTPADRSRVSAQRKKTENKFSKFG